MKSIFIVLFSMLSLSTFANETVLGKPLHCRVWEADTIVGEALFGESDASIQNSVIVTPAGYVVSLAVGKGRTFSQEPSVALISRYLDVRIENRKGKRIISQYSAVLSSIEYVLSVEHLGLTVTCNPKN